MIGSRKKNRQSDNLNISIISEEIELTIKKHPTKKSPGLDDFTFGDSTVSIKYKFFGDFFKIKEEDGTL